MNLTRTFAVAAWALALIASPLVLPIAFILWLRRSIVVMLSTFYRPDLLEPIKDLELSFCADDFWHRPLGSNAFVWILQGPIDFSVVEGRMSELLKNRTEDYARLVRLHPTVWLNVPFWCQTCKFELADHMKIDLDTNIRSEEELRGFICEYLQSPFPRGQPCWDVCYVNNVVGIRGESGAEKRAVFIFRVHHILGDGLSMLKFLEEISDEPAFVRTGPPVKKEIEFQSWRTFFQDQIPCLFYAPLMLVHQIKEFACHSDFLTRRKKSQQLSLSWTTVPFHRVKNVRRKLVQSGNQLPTIAAYNWIVSGAMRQYWKRDGNKSDEELRGAGNLIASLPFQGQDAPSEKFQNVWTHGILRLPLDESCPGTRRKIILENCRWVSKFKTPKVFRFLLPLQRLLPYGMIRKIVSRNMGAPVGLTNIAGPQTQVYLGGQQVVGKYAIVGLQWPHASLSYGFFTYNGTLSVSLLGNQEIFGSPFQQKAADKILNNYFHDELLLLAEEKKSFDKSGD